MGCTWPASQFGIAGRTGTQFVVFSGLVLHVDIHVASLIQDEDIILLSVESLKKKLNARSQIHVF